MQKKHIIFLFVFIVFLIFVWNLMIWWIINRKLSTLGTSIESRMGNQVNDIKKSNFLWLQATLIETITLAKKSVVSIAISKDIKFYVDDPSQLNGPGTIQQQTAKIWWWSGIIVSKQGYIITNKHVVQDITAKYSVTLYDGTTYNVDKIWFDDLLDLAILKIIDSAWNIPNALIPASFLSLRTHVDIGQFALVIGNSLSSYSNNVTLWIIWGKNKQLFINKKNLYIWLYQTDALVNPGNSGGPLLDIEWNVLGITTAITEWQWIAFALPISKEFISGTIKSIESLWKIARPIIGIQYIDITPTLKQEKNITIDTGIYITDVLADLPAFDAWLQIWDSIIAINGNQVHQQLPFLYQLYTYIPGEQISLDIIRNGEKLNFTLLLGWKTP